MRINTESSFKVGQEVDEMVDCWPNIYPIKDAVCPDQPRLVRVRGTVETFIEGNESRLNVVVIDDKGWK